MPHRCSTAGTSALLMAVLVLAPSSAPAGSAASMQAAKPKPCSGKDETCRRINEWFDAGEAAGNEGDAYQNCDGHHAPLNLAAHPQMKVLEMRNYAGQVPRDFPGALDAGGPGACILANASLASPDFSLVSITMCVPGAARRAYDHYVANHHWFHPAHHDYAHASSGNSDWFPAMFPYMTASVGSSGTELDEMEKFVHALSALRPDVKKKLREAGLVMPTLQMCARRARVATDKEYLSAAAHPSAFEDRANGAEMAKLAHAIQADAVPPFARIKVLEETFAAAERLFDTPASIARFHREAVPFHTVTVSAEDSSDLNRRPLTYHWALLRGDPKEVTIEKKNDSGSTVVIRFPKPSPAPIPGTEIKSSLLVVAAFVRNGAWYSAPAFVTCYNPADNRRMFDAQGNLKNP